MQRQDIEKWLTITHSEDSNGTYRHTWCRQQKAGKWNEFLPRIVEYLERAHRDAREYFHSPLHLSLDPIPTKTYQPSYLTDMPLDAKKGFFGEALCGMFTETMEIIGGDKWIIPAFLFRLHPEAEEHLFRLIMKEKVPKSIPGRSGSDFIALSLKDARITKFLSGEAKCHERFNITKCKGFLKELGEEGPTPVSLPQLMRILEDLDQGDLTEIIEAIDDVFFGKKYDIVPKANLFLYLFDDPGVANYQNVRISEALKQENYSSEQPLHVFEVHIPDATQLVKTAYDRVYREVATDVAG